MIVNHHFDSQQIAIVAFIHNLNNASQHFENLIPMLENTSTNSYFVLSETKFPTLKITRRCFLSLANWKSLWDLRNVQSHLINFRSIARFFSCLL